MNIPLWCQYCKSYGIGEPDGEGSWDTSNYGRKTSICSREKTYDIETKPTGHCSDFHLNWKYYDELMKHYKLFKPGDKVEITFSHSDDLGKTGTIVEVRPSFCVIDEGRYKQNGKPWYYNHTYGQFKKIE